MMCGRTPLHINFLDEELDRDIELVFNHDLSSLELVCTRTNKVMLSYGQHEIQALMMDIENFALDESDEFFLQGYLSCAWGITECQNILLGS